MKTQNIFIIREMNFYNKLLNDVFLNFSSVYIKLMLTHSEDIPISFSFLDSFLRFVL